MSTNVELSLQTERHALKEWAVVVEALRDGQSIVTVRKGGIRETAREFRVEQSLFTLYPTYEHQNPSQLGDRYVERLQGVIDRAPGPGLIRLEAWAEVTDVVEVTGDAVVQAIATYSVFSPAYAVERLQWRPKKPLSVLVLRVYRFVEPLTMEALPEYGGCKSWIELADGYPLDRSRPALDHESFAEERDRVLGVLSATR